ncbi:pentapeptide repeat-containing protein [Catellatospora chokoriensis]|uniref:pentapeptide repeat-containing protein n=1 Tax=Catellatospora chokoriensis TaxID=310353 RepID=UPI00177F4008|nr:pentapeptide repeat-containing protein [Catellatospora chokoriensis]
MGMRPKRYGPAWRKITKRRPAKPQSHWTQHWVAVGAILLAIGTIAGPLVAIYAITRSDAANLEQQRIGLEQQRLTERGQITDRFTRANDQLSSDKLEARLGGIYALEQIMKDATEVYEDPTIEIISAYIRSHSPRPSAGTAEPSASPRLADGPVARPVDVQAALTVLSRRPGPDSHQRIDLTGANLVGANLYKGNLSRALLVGADLRYSFLIDADLHHISLFAADLRWANLSAALLTGAFMAKADLRDAVLSNADLNTAELLDADLSRANLRAAHLRGANLAGANLAGADLSSADLTIADLAGADLRGANLSGANLAGADLRGANLSGVDMSRADLTGAVLT